MRRQVELAHAEALVADLRAAIEHEEAPDILGRVLTSAHRLSPEARAHLAAAVLEDLGQTLHAIVDAACPPGTERRLRLGHAVSGAAAGGTAGVPTRLLDAAVVRALERASATGASAGEGPATRLRPSARFQDGCRVVLEESAVPPPVVTQDRPEPPPREARAPSMVERALGPQLAAVAHRLLELEGRVDRLLVRLAPMVAHHGIAPGLERAGLLLERARFRAGVARGLVGASARTSQVSRLGLAARLEVAHLRRDVFEALDLVQARVERGLPLGPTAGEFGELDRFSGLLIGELARFQAKSDVLLQADLQRREGTPTLGVKHLASLGSAFDSDRPAPQTLWNATALTALVSFGRARGVLGRELSKGHAELAQLLLRSHRPSATSGAREGLTTAHIAAALKLDDLYLRDVDPSQLAPAVAFVRAAPPGEGGARVCQILNAFRVLATLGAAPLAHREIVSLLTATFGIEADSVARLRETVLEAKLHEVATLVNAGPGPVVLQLGTSTLTFTVGPDWQITGLSSVRRGAFAPLRRALHGVAPLVMVKLSRLSAARRVARTLRSGMRAAEAVQGVITASGLLAFGAYRLASRDARAEEARLAAALAARDATEAAAARRALGRARTRAETSFEAGALASFEVSGRMLSRA